jgi:hypothetical protein
VAEAINCHKAGWDTIVPRLLKPAFNSLPAFPTNAQRAAARRGKDVSNG